MKRVLVTVFAMAFAAAGFAADVEDICGVGVPVNPIDETWTITLAYKVSVKGQSLQRTADVDCGDCGCIFDLGTMAKINDKTYMIINVDLPVASMAEWFCSGEAIGPNAAGIDLNNVWMWFGDELVDFEDTGHLDSWKLKGFMDDKTADKKVKQVKALYAMTWFTSYSGSESGNEEMFFDEDAFQFPPAPHLTVPTRDMQTQTLSMQLLSDNNKVIAVSKLVGDKDCTDMLLPVPMQFDGCLHGFVDWYNPHVNCWEHLNLDVSARLDKKLTKCLNTCTIVIDDGCDFENPTQGTAF
jgi:hypothetical protein